MHIVYVNKKTVEAVKKSEGKQSRVASIHPSHQYPFAIVVDDYRMVQHSEQMCYVKA